MKFNDRSDGYPIKFLVLRWRQIKVSLAYVQLTFILNHRIHGFLLMELKVRKVFQGDLFPFEY